MDDGDDDNNNKGRVGDAVLGRSIAAELAVNVDDGRDVFGPRIQTQSHAQLLASWLAIVYPPHLAAAEEEAAAAAATVAIASASGIIADANPFAAAREMSKTTAPSASSSPAAFLTALSWS
jgi:hypothetical protein